MFLRDKFVAVSLLSLLPLIGANAQRTTTPQTTERREMRVFIGGESYLGVQTENVSKENAGKYNLSEPHGVAITEVVKGSPAEAAGLQNGDVIIRFDNEDVKSVNKLTRLINDVAPDQKARLTILRNGAEQEITVTMGKRPQAQFGGTLPQLVPMPPLEDFRIEREDGMVMPRLPQMPDGNVFRFYTGATRRIGVVTEPLNKQLGEYFGVADGKGLLVMEVIENSPASKAGIKAGDVIVEVAGQSVSRPEELIRALGKEKEGDVNLTVVRGKTRQSFKVTPEKVEPRPFMPMELMKPTN
jgi:serine protease Do